METPGRREDALTVLAFALAIALPLAGTRWNPPRELRGAEKRILAPRPPPLEHAKALEPWLREWENFMRDHFGGRDACITLYNRLHYALFGESGSSRVIAGTDGWFYFTGHRSIDAARGALPDDDPAIDQWVTLFTDRRDWLAERGARYVVVVAPDKHTIHPEHLPPRLKRVSSSNRLDRVLAGLARAGVEAIDLRPALRAGLAEGPLYLKADSHWNQRGAAIAARVVAERLGWPFTPRRFVPVRKQGGDLADMMAMSDHLSEDTVRADPRVPGLEKVLESAPSRPGPRALVMRDSFGTFLMFLEGVAFTAYDGYQLEPDVFERANAPVVVQELVERRFNEGPWKGAAVFSADGTLRQAFRRAPHRERYAKLPPVDLPAGQYAVLRLETHRQEPGLAVLAGETPAGKVTSERRVPGGRGVLYIPAGGLEPTRGLTLSFLGPGETRVDALELATGVTGADLTPTGKLTESLSFFGQELVWQVPPAVSAGATFVARLRARNPGHDPWLPGGFHGTRLRTQWLAQGGGHEPVHHALPAIGGGVSRELTLSIAAPATPGRYTLRATVEQEPDIAFTDKGARPGDAIIDVR